ncbi:hypothetical protein AU255_08325 [Methyloprofundus sedimenti]|uniref:Uncharacterized protein n=1 Tax=Methyloprofundus sedimenti TaxID=1420851 RepID=A0A1V8M8E9_9GAMM|nr:hypothetical protein [Methyloprofundus sedimenti]OQK17854.1 hypothetical protein AU255_08325 [Methyloprofundus sedimenti]
MYAVKQGVKLAAPGIIVKVLAKFRISRSKSKAIILKDGVLMIFSIWSAAHNKLLNDRLRLDAQNAARPLARRVCRAWHRTREVQVLLPGIREAEG